MHQTNSSFSSSSLSSFPAPSFSAAPTARAPLAPGFDATTSLGRLQTLIDTLDRYLRLPTTPRAFFLYLVALILISAGATLYVVIAAQILQAEVQLARMEQQLATIDQQNGDLIWKIARETNMKNLHERILAAGYVRVEERAYMVVEADPDSPVTQAQPADPAPTTAGQNTPEAWQSFFALRWRSAPMPDLSAAPIRLPESDTADPPADQWRRWWKELIDGSAAFLQQAAAR